MSGPRVISIDEEIQFLVNVVIPSFDPDLHFPSSKERKAWMNSVAIGDGWSPQKVPLLIRIFSSIDTLEKAEEKLAIAKHDADDAQRLSRLVLLDRRAYDNDLDKLLGFIDKAQLPVPKSSVIEHYRKGECVRDSDAYAIINDVPSTVASRAQFDMSNFDIASLHGDFAVKILVVTLSKDKLRTLIAGRLFSSSIDELDRCLAELTPVLDKLRSYFIFLREMDFDYSEPGWFQPIYTLFLERVASRIGKTTCNVLGSEFALSIDAEVKFCDGSSDVVAINGKTDIVKIPSPVYIPDDVEFLMELKSPFGKLYHKSSDGPKGQLICQLLGLCEMSSERRSVVMGGLTDIFALMVCFAYAGEKRKFMITKSVVDTEDYLLHLMLLFCSADCDVRDLIAAIEEVPQPIADSSNDDETPHTNSVQGPAADSSGRALRSTTRAHNSRVGASGTTTAAAPTKWKKNKVFTEEDFEFACDAESALQRWYARHNGFVPLTEENLENYFSI